MAVGMDLDLDLLSGIQCGVSKNNVCELCETSFYLLCICIVTYLIENIFFSCSFYSSPFWINKLNSAAVWNLQDIMKAFFKVWQIVKSNFSEN